LTLVVLVTLPALRAAPGAGVNQINGLHQQWCDPFLFLECVFSTLKYHLGFGDAASSRYAVRIHF